MDTDPHERIRRRAYELWGQEGRPEGRADDHWYRAEAEVAGAHPGASGDDARDGPAPPVPPAPAIDSGDGTRATAPGTKAGARRDRGRRSAPSDLAADEAAKGGGGVGP